MVTYRIRLKVSAAKEIESIQPKKVRRRIVDRIARLAENPRPPGCEKLSGHHRLYRIRHGAYRIVYSHEDEILTVFVIKVGHRSSVYRGY